jgi:hypothetical protein
MPAFGASQGDWDDCSKTGGDPAIAACTRILNGNETPRDRAIAYNNRGIAWGTKGDHCLSRCQDLNLRRRPAFLTTSTTRWHALCDANFLVHLEC